MTAIAENLNRVGNAVGGAIKDGSVIDWVKGSGKLLAILGAGVITLQGMDIINNPADGFVADALAIAQTVMGAAVGAFLLIPQFRHFSCHFAEWLGETVSKKYKPDVEPGINGLFDTSNGTINRQQNGVSLLQDESVRARNTGRNFETI